MRTQIAALLLVFSALSARAAPDEAIVQEVTRRTHIAADEVRRSYDACDSGVTLSMVICGSYLWVAEDIRLNRIYQQALAKARSMAIESSLVAAQRAWLVYRDKACEMKDSSVRAGVQKRYCMCFRARPNSPSKGRIGSIKGWGIKRSEGHWLAETHRLAADIFGRNAPDKASATATGPPHS